MSETQEDTPNDQTSPALDDFVENVAKLNDGLSEMMTGALRMQALMMEDAQNMMAEFRAAAAATAQDRDNNSDA